MKNAAARKLFTRAASNIDSVGAVRPASVKAPSKDNNIAANMINPHWGQAFEMHFDRPGDNENKVLPFWIPARLYSEKQDYPPQAFPRNNPPGTSISTANGRLEPALVAGNGAQQSVILKNSDAFDAENSYVRITFTNGVFNPELSENTTGVALSRESLNMILSRAHLALQAESINIRSKIGQAYMVI
ncbi:hypothetical protein [Variovorax sp. RHLX14]|uniref:hypothetical protein n=1 Tax=Variovorax sp. RHLX14 TaxID=1259731 RepID=UPI003F499572